MQVLEQGVASVHGVDCFEALWLVPMFQCDQIAFCAVMRKRLNVE